MSKPQELPNTLLEAVRYFADLNVATEFVAKMRWPDGPVCPSCGGVEYSYLTTRRLWKCKACKKQYSVKVGTIFEDSALGLDKWLPAVWLIANSKNGISSHELGRALGTTQKSAWFMLHRIRLAMQSGSFDMLSGTVEVDETFIGGKARNMHKADRRRKFGAAMKGMNPATGKTPVLGMIERDGKVRARVVDDTKTLSTSIMARRSASVSSLATISCSLLRATHLLRYSSRRGPSSRSASTCCFALSSKAISMSPLIVVASRSVPSLSRKVDKHHATPIGRRAR